MSDEWKFVDLLQPLTGDAVQIWRIDLATDPRLLSEFREYLTQAELERADRRLPGRVRAEFVIGRACLRILLASELDMRPLELPLLESTYGKPELAISNLGFNVSHSRGTILIAISKTGTVGVDVEYIDLERDVAELISSVCTEQEAELLMLPHTIDARQRLFYKCWVRKEAAIKAEGRGLSIPLTQFDVSLASAADNLTVRVESEELSMAAKCYFLSDIPLGSDLAGAVAVDSPNCRIQLFNFPLSALENDLVKK